MASYDDGTNLVDDEYDDLDDFIVDNEDDVVLGEEQQDEFEEEEEEQEEEEEEEPPVGQVEILTLREQLKADIRRKNQAQQGATAGRASCSSSVQPLAKDRFGSFFGPSRPSLARRVIEEGCSSIIKEKQNVPSNKSSVSSASKKQPIPSGQQQKPKFVKEEKRKVDALRQNRDYSYVGDIASTSKLISQTDKVSKDSGLKGPSIQSRVRLVGKEPHPNTKRTIASSAKNGSSLPAMKKIQRVQPSSNGQKMQQTLQSKRPQAMLSQSHGQQSLQSRKPKPSLNGQNFRQKVSAPLAQKHLAPSSRPKPSSAVHNDHGKGKTRRLVKRKSKEDGCDEEEVDYKSIIRGMFNYNPAKFVGRDEDDRDMEANYASIQMEERRSARLARQEDDEELRRIMDEERREKQERKRKKLAQKAVVDASQD
uniref:Protein SPT2 homolog n=1 Tax=Oryza nivara TaxID=4536 RepID=A0A0E0GAU3_ORYNI